MVFENTVTLGALLTFAAMCLGFIGQGIMTVVALARRDAIMEVQLKSLDERLERVEQVEERMSEVLIKIAESRTELHLLSDRINDVQRHGSHRLAEILAGYQQRQQQK